MFSYVTSKDKFIKDFETGHIVSMLETEVKHIYRKSLMGEDENDRYNDGELASWRVSIPYMAAVLRDNRIPDDVGIAMEYVLEKPDEFGAFRRADIMLSGKDEDGIKNIVIVEMKQYSNLKWDESNGEFVNVFYGKEQNPQNPAEQLKKYADIIASYNDGVKNGRIRLKKVVYLHNLKDIEDVDETEVFDRITKEKIEQEGLSDAVFYEGNVADFRDFIIDNIGAGEGVGVFKDFIKGEPVASYNLYMNISRFFEAGDDDGIYLRRDQSDCFFDICTKIDERLAADTEDVLTIVINGGPGSGKSIVGLKLLKKYFNDGARYVACGAAMNNTIIKQLPEDSMYSERISYFEAVSPGDTIVIVDEAHRCSKNNRQHLEETYHIDGVKVIVLIYDELQIYKEDALVYVKGNRNDYDGEEILFLPEDTPEYGLDSQFRCGGDLGYLLWLNKVLYGEWCPYSLPDLFFDVDIVNSFDELKDIVDDENNHILAAALLRNGEDNDIKLYGPTQITMEGSSGVETREVVTVPSYEDYRSYRIPDDNRIHKRESVLVIEHFADGINHYGDVNNIQGVEVVNAVVIVGDELQIQGDGRLTASDAVYNNDRCRKTILGLRRQEDMPVSIDGNGSERGRELTVEEKERVDKYVKNMYRILLTRGLMSCRIYFKNDAVREYFLNA